LELLPEDVVVLAVVVAVEVDEAAEVIVEVAGAAVEVYIHDSFSF
jgi:hypothetical protein